MKKIKINLAVVIIIMQFFGSHIPALSMTINREEKTTNFERSAWNDLGSFAYVKDLIDRSLEVNLSSDREISWQQGLSNNCFKLLTCQESEKDSASVAKLNILESLQALKINGEHDEALGIGYVPILARSELGDIYKGVYDYDIDLDRDSSNNALVLSASSESLKFFINPKKSSYSNLKKTNWNRFKTSVAFKYDSLKGVNFLAKGKQSKINNKIASLNILPSNYSGLKIQIYNNSGKKNYDKSKNSKIAKLLPKYQVAYAMTNSYQSQAPVWQQKIDRQLESKRQQLANQQLQFKIKMEQDIQKNYREQERQQEILVQRTNQELGQALIKQQQQQSQPIQNYY